jgi:hypothetical protein
MLGALLFAPIAVSAAPVTDADLRGKRICWDDGSTTDFGKDGSWDNSRLGHGAWSLTGGSLMVTLSNGNARLPATINKEDGGIHLLRRAAHGNIVERRGKYCG